MDGRSEHAHRPTPHDGPDNHRRQARILADVLHQAVGQLADERLDARLEPPVVKSFFPGHDS